MEQPTPTYGELKLERDVYAAGAGTSAASGTPSTHGSSPASPLQDRMLKQKMASSIILGALTKKLAAEVYLLELPPSMLMHMRMTYNVKCSASVGAAKREYIGLYLDSDSSMIEHIKNTQRVIDELLEQHVVAPHDEKRQNFMQSPGPAWNVVLKSCGTFDQMMQRCRAEAIRREQQKYRRATGGSSGGKSAAAFSAESAGKHEGAESTKKKGMVNVKCFNCYQLEHFTRDCKNERTSQNAEAASMVFTWVT
ncbi:hypothetical protein PF008_g9821 [Phytophthora fragariae]|uniref:CCHC-type domain-containing protein n=1 Tax=Phytophthora fragariae TaxID=53985 RepID=A0A6G0RVQ0_9STRA|nr:hypothetical protein PF008_g9821 [Phytophthora fragariae]